MEKKLKISGRRLRKILLPAVALTTALAITVTMGMYANAATLDNMFGKGTLSVTVSDQTDWQADYYEQPYASTEEALAAAAIVSKQISDEGIVLLKNDGLLPLSKSTAVSPFGLRYCLPFYGGSGSSAIGTGDDYIVTPSEGLHAVFDHVNSQLENLLIQAAAAGDDLDSNNNILKSVPASDAAAYHTLYEFDSSLYQSAANSCKGTVGIVFIGRKTGESCDASTSVYDDGSAHMLALSAAERRTIAFAKEACTAVIVVLACSSPMEIAELEDDSGISAILWMGGAGCSGYASLGDILVGNVNPSGKTPDIWPANFKNDPTFANQDDGSELFTYANAYTTLVSNTEWLEHANTPFREYEEGVYMGYRYYETAWAIGALKDYNNRTDGILYPFGYGLSYTSFSQKLTACTVKGNTVSVTVRVTNTGTQYSGKDTVQLYLTAPYTDFDRQYAIEKPAALLIAFGKTDVLGPGESEDVLLTFDKEYMASYCYTHNNGDDTAGSYVLEEGTYTLSLRGNSHQVLDAATVDIPWTIWYNNQNPRDSEILAQSELDLQGVPVPSPTQLVQAATNQFPTLSAYMSDASLSQAVILTRSDWAATQPTAPTEKDRQASPQVVQWILDADSTQASERAPLPVEVPAADTDNGLGLADLRGKYYNDPAWDQLMDQLSANDWEDVRLCLFSAGYKTGAVAAIGKPESTESDGPQGLTFADVDGNNWLQNVCAFPTVPVMAATWNQGLMYTFGYMVGQEALLSGINGWYAPALNLHRSPFGGRVSEYFSEDPVLTGLLGAQILSGGGDAGIYCIVKHFALMETETHKNPHTAVWMTEQALRELYLKPYEIALKTARKTICYLDQQNGVSRVRTMRAGDFVMAADCGVGAQWAAANEALLTQVLRNEWGFQGAVISDMHQLTNSNQVKNLLYAGCDLLMSTAGNTAIPLWSDATGSSSDALRTAMKHLCYPLANSNLMQGIPPGSQVEYHLPPWQIGLMTVDGIVGLCILGILIWLLFRAWDEYKYPENYK